MPRLMDMGLEKLRNMVLDMAELSQNTVSTSIDAYVQGRDLRDRIYSWSEELRMLQDEVSELAVELIARYQPVATDLRFIRSCMEIAYGFSRFGRYAYDIVEVLETIGHISECDKTAVLRMASTVREMILLSVHALQLRDKNASAKLYEMDDTV